jgi:hypothetical protein
MKRLTLLLLTMALVALASTFSFGDEQVSFRNGETSFTFSDTIGQDGAFVIKDLFTSRKLYMARVVGPSTGGDKWFVGSGGGLAYRPKSSIWNNGIFVNGTVKGFYTGNEQTIYTAETDLFLPVSSKNKGFALYEVGILQVMGDNSYAVFTTIGREGKSDYWKIGGSVPIPSTNMNAEVGLYGGQIKTWYMAINIGESGYY